MHLLRCVYVCVWVGCASVRARAKRRKNAKQVTTTQGIHGICSWRTRGRLECGSHPLSTTITRPTRVRQEPPWTSAASPPVSLLFRTGALLLSEFHHLVNSLLSFPFASSLWARTHTASTAPFARSHFPPAPFLLDAGDSLRETANDLLALPGELASLCGPTPLCSPRTPLLDPNRSPPRQALVQGLFTRNTPLRARRFSSPSFAFRRL